MDYTVNKGAKALPFASFNPDILYKNHSGVVRVVYPLNVGNNRLLSGFNASTMVTISSHNSVIVRGKKHLPPPPNYRTLLAEAPPTRGAIGMGQIHQILALNTSGIFRCRLTITRWQRNIPFTSYLAFLGNHCMVHPRLRCRDVEGGWHWIKRQSQWIHQIHPNTHLNFGLPPCLQLFILM